RDYIGLKLAVLVERSAPVCDRRFVRQIDVEGHYAYATLGQELETLPQVALPAEGLEQFGDLDHIAAAHLAPEHGAGVPAGEAPAAFLVTVGVHASPAVIGKSSGSFSPKRLLQSVDVRLTGDLAGVSINGLHGDSA